MHFMCLTISAIVLNAAVASAHPTLEKLRRGSSGLSPFPRVGRGSVGQTWLDDYGIADLERPQKRALYTFPRVGRNDGSEGGDLRWSRLPAPLQLRQLEELLLNTRPRSYSKRNSDSGNMWFGPRLGRAAKRDTEEYDEDSSPSQESATFERAEEPEISHEKSKIQNVN